MHWLAVAAACGVTALVWILRARFVVVTVTGDSMLPSLRQGDRVLVRRRRLSNVDVGQVIVLASLGAPGGGWIVKRLMALPGQPVPPGSLPASMPLDGHVSPGALIVRGDNAEVSYDSRQAGFIAADRVLGVVVRRVGDLYRSGGMGV